MNGGGIFISFEGIDGAGKSTHIEALAAALQTQGTLGTQITLTREPGGTTLAEKLRTLVLNDPMDELTEALLIFAARRDHLVRVIEPALAVGGVVLCDRFTDATFAYQGGGRGFDLEILTILEQWVQSRSWPQGELILQPDLTLWFDLPSEIAARRLTGARVPDRFEAQPVEFFNRVARGYALRAEQAPGRFERIDATGDRHAVWAQIVQIMVRRGWLTDEVAAKPDAA
ncbi:MAG: dTMP kinase [Rhodoferax sp.]